jgi:hypothetical protein
VAVFVFGVVLVVIMGSIIDIVPAQHLPAEVDEDLVNVH